MHIDDHFALSTGTAPLDDGRHVQLTVHDLGMVRVPSGLLGACDPFVALDNPVIIPIEAGDYPVYVTVADVSEEQDGSHPREAYLSLLFSREPSVSVTAATGINGTPPPDEFSFVGVDSGTVAFVDSEAVLRSMPEDVANWQPLVFETGASDDWFSIMDADEPHAYGFANIVMPRATAGENVVLSHSGWGDGVYPVLETRDAGGALTGIHIDLQVVGRFEEPPAPADAAPTRRSWIARLLGR